MNPIAGIIFIWQADNGNIDAACKPCTPDFLTASNRMQTVCNGPSQSFFPTSVQAAGKIHAVFKGPVK
jgi:hypothetical protein